MRSQRKLSKAEELYRTALKYNPQQSRAHLDLGIVLVGLRKQAEAIPHFAAALEDNPSDIDARKRLIVIVDGLGRSAEAVPHRELLLQHDPGDAVARIYLGKALMEKGDAAGAANQYREALRVKPKWLVATNDLAWLLATTQDESVRDGAEAVRLAEFANKATGNKAAAILDTLAAAQAEAGQFDKAVATAKQALEITIANGPKQHVPQLRKRLRAYQDGKPHREVYPREK